MLFCIGWIECCVCVCVTSLWHIIVCMFMRFAEKFYSLCECILSRIECYWYRHWLAICWFYIQFTLAMSTHLFICECVFAKSFKYSWFFTFAFSILLIICKHLRDLSFFEGFTVHCAQVNVSAYLNPNLDYSQRHSFDIKLQMNTSQTRQKKSAQKKTPLCIWYTIESSWAKPNQTDLNSK